MKQLASDIKIWGLELGFQQIGITDTDLSQYEARFLEWLTAGFHGSMSYMEKHGVKRSRPAELIPGTIRVISARLDYLPPDTSIARVLGDARKGYISRYALGRDYHRLMRKRLEELAQKISAAINQDDTCVGFHANTDDDHSRLPHDAISNKLNYRVFTDSAPVLEKSIAEKAGLGWIGKHTNLINSKAGSWFFLGEIYTNIPLPIDEPITKSHCGSCTACIDICPTQAIVGPYQVDARRCISYLTIESRDSIPVELRPLLGNRIYGCDDCQIVCPWNKFAKHTREKDFYPRRNLHTPELLDLFAWTEDEFLRYTEGSAIRRIGYDCWLRNIAVALGNAPRDERIITALKTRAEHASALVREHVAWALTRQCENASTPPNNHD